MSDKEYNIFNLSLSDTTVMKGIAIIAMLCHHTFTCRPSFETPYPEFLTALGILGKVCVSMFLFCSGYGLAVQYEKGINKIFTLNQKFIYSLKFIVKRLLKFYTSYWFIFILFIPLGIFVFDRSLADAYGENVNLIKRISYDLLGIQGFQSYNITWWFNKLIIIFYLLFPIIFIISRKIKFIGIFISFLLMRFANKFGELNYYDLFFWQFPLVVGMYYAIYKDTLNNFSSSLSKYRITTYISVFVIFIFCVVQRLYGVIPLGYITGIRVDTFLTLSILLILLFYIRNIPWLYKPLSILGNHSMNIYLIHTFFNHYWDFSRKLLHDSYLRMGGVNVIALLLLCLVLSIIIEWLKEKIYWNKLSSQIINKINNL